MDATNTLDPTLQHICDFADVLLAFGADLLARAGIADGQDHYISKMSDTARDVFLNRRHCMFTFLADTTTLTLV